MSSSIFAFPHRGSDLSRSAFSTHSASDCPGQELDILPAKYYYPKPSLIDLIGPKSVYALITPAAHIRSTPPISVIIQGGESNT